MMQSQLPVPASPKWVRTLFALGPLTVPLLIAFECSLQSMILFEGFFLALFLLPVALWLQPFLASDLRWPAGRVVAWSRASVFGTLTAVFLTLCYAFEVGGSFDQTGVSPGAPNTAQYLTVAIGFPLVLGFFQAVAIGPQLKWSILWPVVPAIACLLSYGASQILEIAERIDQTGLITLVLTLVAAFFITYWIQKAGLRFLQSKSGTAGTEDIPIEEEISQPSVALALEPEVLEARRARIAAGQCPRCGAQLKPADQNCPSCRVNLAFVRAHLDQW
jgi:hypothetical protein